MYTTPDARTTQHGSRTIGRRVVAYFIPALIGIVCIFTLPSGYERLEDCPLPVKRAGEPASSVAAAQRCRAVDVDRAPGLTFHAILFFL